MESLLSTAGVHSSQHPSFKFSDIPHKILPVPWLEVLEVDTAS